MKFDRRRVVYQEPRYFYLFVFLNFFIIVFFLSVILPLISSSGSAIKLPKILNQQSSFKKNLTITMLDDETIFVSDQVVVFAQLKNIFDKESVVVSGGNILLKAKNSVSIKALTQVVDLLKQAGFKNIYVATGA